LSAEERQRLDELIRTGKRPVQLLTKAPILPKADAAETGDGWSGSRRRSVAARIRKPLTARDTRSKMQFRNLGNVNYARLR
jgi:hypothetical protein